MTDTYLELKRDLQTVLNGIAPTYDFVPQQVTGAYIVTRISSEPWESSNSTGMLHRVTVNIFERAKTSKNIATLRKSVYNALNRQESVLTNSAPVLIMIQGVNTIALEPDGKTWRAIMEFKVITD